jgi:DNA-binding FadR family transcriptional regulator
MAARHATADDLEAIAQAVERDDDAFRRAVISASHNELLIVLADAIGRLNDPAPTATLHGDRPVADAIERRDPDEAEEAMRRRVRQPG